MMPRSLSATRLCGSNPDGSAIRMARSGRGMVGADGVAHGFAAWAGKPGLPLKALRDLTLGSYEFGRERIAEIAAIEHASRNITPDLADEVFARIYPF